MDDLFGRRAEVKGTMWPATVALRITAANLFSGVLAPRWYCKDRVSLLDTGFEAARGAVA